jgi:uncharacterized metal-binding protein YceD (DUF177 family)
MSKYDIAYKGLAEGKHEFDFQIDAKFFELFDESIVEQANVVAKVTFEKRSAILSLIFKIKGEVELVCDRCLEKYYQPVKQKYKVFIKFGDGQYEEGDDVLWISPAKHQFNIAQLLYEYIVLSIPYQHVHPKSKDGNSTCDQEMIKQLNKYTYVEKEKEPDQRWDALKKLKK